MFIRSLRLIHFRSYADKSIECSPKITVLRGPNGAGKTNILEGIYLTAVGKSHRGAEDAHMLQFGADEGSVSIDFTKHDVPHQLQVKLLRQGRKAFTMDGNKLTQKELLGTLQVVFFSPEDLQIVKGAPQIRRQFLDLEIAQTSTSYYQQLLQYQRALKQRNRLLKDNKGKPPVCLDDWDWQLAQSAAFLTKKRLRALEKMTMLANLMHRKITEGQENLRLVYHQPYAQEFFQTEGITQKRYITEADDFFKALKYQEPKDRLRMTTSIGPHRDDFMFMTDFGNLKWFGSQGQQRTAALSVKLSELEYIKSEVGMYPVLLLDDVLSELDRQRRDNLLGYIRSRIQTFITATDVEEFAPMKDVSIISI